VTNAGRSLQGDIVLLLNGVDAYCVAPDLHESDSCFHRQEAEALQTEVDTLERQGLFVVSPAFIQEREGVGEFIWRCPQRAGVSCSLDTCEHTQDDPPGLAAVAKPGGAWEKVCLHAECGRGAQEALVDWVEQKKQQERSRQQAELDTLRRVSVERTLLAPAGETIDLSTRSLLEAIQPLLVPDWDTPTMFHAVLGWQEAVRAQLATEMGVADSNDRAVTRQLREQYGELVVRPKNGNILRMFRALREELTSTDEGLRCWVSCLALIRSWRDEVETVEQITGAIQYVSSCGKADHKPETTHLGSQASS
jgi:hypothetical protein